MRITGTLAAAVASVALVASWPLAQSAWQGHQAEQGRQALIEQVEAAPPTTASAPSGPGGSAGLLGPAGSTGAGQASGRSGPGATTTPVAGGVPEGDPFATVRIARFGADWHWPLLEGTSEEVIADGPGHYVGTPLPGAAGNVGIAAHRAGHGDPFIDFDDLRVGDEVEISQGGTTWVYTLTMAPEIVPVDAMWVLDPTREHTLTLTTCWPKYGSSERMYVHAELTDVRHADA